MFESLDQMQSLPYPANMVRSSKLWKISRTMPFGITDMRQTPCRWRISSGNVVSDNIPTNSIKSWRSQWQVSIQFVRFTISPLQRSAKRQRAGIITKSC